MRVRMTLWLIGLVLTNTGCSVVADAVHTTSSRTRQSISDAYERHRNKQWAAAAWDDVRKADPAVPASGDFADGFRDGFAEYLYRGSTEPPPLPPGRYRTVHSQSSAGYHAAEAWFAGYRRGIAEGQARGAREWVVGPSSLRGGCAPAVPGWAETPDVRSARQIRKCPETLTQGTPYPVLRTEPAALPAGATRREGEAAVRADPAAVGPRVAGLSHPLPPVTVEPVPPAPRIATAAESCPPPATDATAVAAPTTPVFRPPVIGLVTTSGPVSEIPADKPVSPAVDIILTGATVTEQAADGSMGHWHAAPGADGPVRWRAAPARPATGPGGGSGTVQDRN